MDRPIYVTVAAAHLHSPQTLPPSLSIDPPRRRLGKIWACPVEVWVLGSSTTPRAHGRKGRYRGHSIDQWCGVDSINEVKLCVVKQVCIYVRGLVRSSSIAKSVRIISAGSWCTKVPRIEAGSQIEAGCHHHHHHHHHGEDGSRPQRPLYPRNKNNITHYLYTNY